VLSSTGQSRRASEEEIRLHIGDVELFVRQGQLAPQKITLWHVAARINPQGKEVVEWLGKHATTKPDDRDAENLTPLMLAAMGGNALTFAA
jgi:hypothetical protein